MAVTVNPVVAAVLLLVIVGQIVPLQVTLPTKGLEPTRASSTIMRSGDWAVMIEQETGEVALVFSHFEALSLSSAGGDCADAGGNAKW